MQEKIYSEHLKLKMFALSKTHRIFKFKKCNTNLYKQTQPRSWISHSCIVTFSWGPISVISIALTVGDKAVVEVTDQEWWVMAGLQLPVDRLLCLIERFWALHKIIVDEMKILKWQLRQHNICKKHGCIKSNEFNVVVFSVKDITDKR